MTQQTEATTKAAINATIIATINATNDLALRSWVASANREGTDFPIQNLPFGIFRRIGIDEPLRGGVAIGARIIDLQAALRRDLFSGDALAAAQAASQATLNALMALAPCYRVALRARLSQLLRADASAAQQDALRSCLVPQSEAEYALPAQIGEIGRASCRERVL